MRIAYFSPLNPQPTGIADYSEELLPHLARYSQIDLFVGDYRPNNPAVTRQFEVFHYRRFPPLRRQRRYDVCLYHMGNHPSHKYIHDTLLYYPGITVLHDCVLHHYFRSTTLESGDPASYVREMGYCYGWPGFDLAHRAMHHIQTFPAYAHPLVDRIIDASLGIIVHSEYLRRCIATTHPNIPIAKINHHLSLPALTSNPPDPAQLRASLGLRDDQLVVASFGHIAPTKRIDVALRAFARLRREFPRAIYLLVGGVVPQYDVSQIIQGLSLENAVVEIGHVTLDDFQRYMTVADVCINLRFPTASETSGSLIRTMGVGKPVIVSNVGAFSELPDDCCVKVDVGPKEEDSLLAQLLSLARDSDLRQQIGLNAQRHVQAHHRIEDSAQGYITFVEQCLESVKRSGTRPPRFSLRRSFDQSTGLIGTH
jgi:glycosyltransferase involved in cell wall biosynthesis